MVVDRNGRELTYVWWKETVKVHDKKTDEWLFSFNMSGPINDERVQAYIDKYYR